MTQLTYVTVHFVVRNKTGGPAWGRYRLSLNTQHGERVVGWWPLAAAWMLTDSALAPDPIVPHWSNAYPNTSYQPIAAGDLVTIDREIVCIRPYTLSGPSIQIDSDPRDGFSIVEPPRIVVPDGSPDRSAYPPIPIDAPREVWTAG